MRPSPALLGRNKTRLAFTTKQVGGGFYRGTRTGSLGAHTPTGGYLIDWRKVRHFVMPDLEQTKLTPYVPANLFEGWQLPTDPDGKDYEEKYDGMQYLKWYKNLNKNGFEYDLEIARKNREMENAFLEDTVQDSMPSDTDTAFGASDINVTDESAATQQDGTTSRDGSR